MSLVLLSFALSSQYSAVAFNPSVVLLTKSNTPANGLIKKPAVPSRTPIVKPLTPPLLASYTGISITPIIALYTEIYNNLDPTYIPENN
jgi:hypothetical protein